MPDGWTPGAAQAATVVPTQDGDDETRRLLQSRLALVFAVSSGVAFFYGITPFVALAVSGIRGNAPVPVPLVTLALGVGYGVLALRCRRGKRSFFELNSLDAVATLVVSWTTAALMTQVRPATEASVSLQLGLTYVLMARAVLLPSSGRRTLTISLLAVLPAAVLATWMRVEALEREATGRDWASHAYMVVRSLLMTAFLATLTSSIIYGLRKRIREVSRVGQYLLREKLGEGGMGVVYRATHALLRRETAVKLLLPDRIDPASLLRFEREVQLTAKLTHPNTVAIFDYGRTPDGVFYYAMEHLDGGDLEQLVAYAGPLPPGRTIYILEQICRALTEAHGLGLVHRDIKPGNVLLCERGGDGDVTKILDFGLVKDLKSESDASLTHDEALTGTPLYMAPEGIAAPGQVSAASDLYSLGALAYFLLTGRPPFTGKNVVEVCAAHLHLAPVAPSTLLPAVPADLDAVVLLCLQKKPEARFRDARAMRDSLLACAASRDWSEDAAAAWWREHRDGFRAHCQATRSARTTKELGFAETESALRIDLQER